MYEKFANVYIFKSWKVILWLVRKMVDYNYLPGNLSFSTGYFSTTVIIIRTNASVATIKCV